MTKTPFGTNQSQASGQNGLFLPLEHLNFEFVSDFEIRISDLTNERFMLRHGHSNMTTPIEDPAVRGRTWFLTTK
jgi:hypothetical protein